MDWQSQLIGVYLTICDSWDQGVWTVAQRYSNNKNYAMMDQEVATIFIFGILRGRNSIIEIYSYANDHLKEWFPNLKSYDSFCYRLNRLSDAFVNLADLLSQGLYRELEFNDKRLLVDSLPIVMANNKRSNSAKVAPDLADKGYCDTKKMYYYGVKLHVAAFDRDNTIPIPGLVGTSPASNHDLTVFRQICPELIDFEVFGDKAYGDKELRNNLMHSQNTEIVVPVKLKKKQKFLDSADKLYSSAVSKIRQPIESFFNWLIEKTAIQKASKVRSANGLLVHIFGRLSAGLLAFKF